MMVWVVIAGNFYEGECGNTVQVFSSRESAEQHREMLEQEYDYADVYPREIDVVFVDG